MKVLLYAFEPSTPGHKNSGLTTAEWVVEGINSEYPGCIDCKMTVLPPYFSCKEELLNAIKSFAPDKTIGFHVSPGKPWVLAEQCALNIIHTHHYPNWLDKDRYMSPIYHNGAEALFTQVDTERLLYMLKEQGVPAEHSFHCGTGIANYAYYIALEKMRQENTIFFHVPQSPEEAIIQGRQVPVFPPWQTAQGIVRWLCMPESDDNEENL